MTTGHSPRCQRRSFGTATPRPNDNATPEQPVSTGRPRAPEHPEHLLLDTKRIRLRYAQPAERFTARDRVSVDTCPLPSVLRSHGPPTTAQPRALSVRSGSGGGLSEPVDERERLNATRRPRRSIGASGRVEPGPHRETSRECLLARDAVSGARGSPCVVRAGCWDEVGSRCG